MSAKSKDQNTCPRFKNVDHGWAWIIAISGFFLHIIVGGHRRSMGLFFLEIVDYYDSTKSEAAMVVSVFYVTSLCVAPIASIMVKKISVRTVVAFGGIFTGIAFVIAAFVKNLEVAILTIGGLSGIGSGLLHAPMLVLVGQYFEKRRTLAMGICLAGGAMGAFIFPPVISYSAKRYGYPGMMLLVSGISLQAVIFAMLLRPPEKMKSNFEEEVDMSNDRIKVDAEIAGDSSGIQVEEMPETTTSEPEVIIVTCKDGSKDKFSKEMEVQVGLEEQNSHEDSVLEPLTSSIQKDPAVNMGLHQRAVTYLRSRKVLLRPAFYLYAVSCALGTEMLPLALYLIPPLCEDFGISMDQQSLILLIMGIPDLISRLSIGFVADRYPRWRADMFIGLLIFKSMLWLFVSFSPDYLKIMIFAQLTGLAGGAIFTLYLPVLVDAMGLENINIVFSVSLVFEGIFCVVLPPLLAYVRDATGSWIGSYRLMTGVAILAGLLIVYDCRIMRTLRKLKISRQENK